MSLHLDRRELLKTFACASVSVGAGGAITSVVSAWAQTTAPRAGTPRISFVRAPLATGDRKSTRLNSSHSSPSRMPSSA